MSVSELASYRGWKYEITRGKDRSYGAVVYDLIGLRDWEVAGDCRQPDGAEIIAEQFIDYVVDHPDEYYPGDEIERMASMPFDDPDTEDIVRTMYENWLGD